MSILSRWRTTFLPWAATFSLTARAGEMQSGEDPPVLRGLRSRPCSTVALPARDLDGLPWARWCVSLQLLAARAAGLRAPAQGGGRLWWAAMTRCPDPGPVLHSFAPSSKRCAPPARRRLPCREAMSLCGLSERSRPPMVWVFGKARPVVPWQHRSGAPRPSAELGYSRGNHVCANLTYAGAQAADLLPTAGHALARGSPPPATRPCRLLARRSRVRS